MNKKESCLSFMRTQTTGAGEWFEKFKVWIDFLRYTKEKTPKKMNFSGQGGHCLIR
jgi:hypothetical protein